MHFCMTIVLTVMEPEACLLYRKNCENLDVDLEAIACVHSLPYSTVNRGWAKGQCGYPTVIDG